MGSEVAGPSGQKISILLKDQENRIFLEACEFP